MWRDGICAVTLLVIAAVYFVLANKLGTSALADAVGPAGLPRMYAGLLALLAIVIGLRPLLQRRSQPAVAAEETEASTRVRLRRAAGALGIGIAYLLALPLIGYPFAIALAIAAMAVYQREPFDLRLALTACIGAGVLYLLFDIVLGVSMPVPWS